MTPKPLTKERREYLAQLTAPPLIHIDAVRDLLAAEAYWRLAVKNVPVNGFADDACVFCKEDATEYHPEKHKPDCAWLRAQD